MNTKNPRFERISVQQVDPHAESAIRLVRALTADLAHRYHDVGDDGSGSFDPSHAAGPRSAFVVARLDGETVGCGALRPIDEDTVEIKRMYVAESARRRGVARAILLELERLAADFGYHLILLETGQRQPEAIALYEQHDFQHIPRYGENIKNSLSVCFEKRIIVTPRRKGRPSS